mmetsp:Transcript_8870/g.13238  ORF Transcript_8870/g.13238 Transcript_8870/m.13238 type:complete len:202 (+) Transcript_8870:36-641(+)
MAFRNESGLDGIRSKIKKCADETSETIDEIMRKIQEVNTAGFLDRSYKTWPIYLKQYTRLFAQLQNLHEAIHSSESFETLNSLLIQPARPVVNLGHEVPTDVMELLRTKPIDEIEEDMKKTEDKAVKQVDSREGKETVKDLVKRLDGYNSICDRMEDLCQSMELSQLKIPPQRQQERNMIQPPTELQRMIDVTMQGDSIRD